ncbi:hypothetical protein QOZ88_08550 [Blastococcus sp. BMG 814]|uniref:Uncharacterized protein n=1 Tax=Blastococcus carthaginiensis TaxID=3050034 RepID=A0ABT9IAU9_9ACTN|nr:hypothetical protein [Blastococcus carthaginiensis]MDP5182689.1 hypothetical protein [Blastococcus carthaginiensis]
MPSPSADAFAALARSSPWRWSTLRFTVSWPGDPWRTAAVRAWLRRPDALRVETLDGALLQAGRDTRLTVATDPAPVLRADGLVAERPWGLWLDDPMFQNYFWVAMLDPAELADPGLDATPGEPPLLLDAVTEVEHAGRPAWEAVVRTTPEYEPRCGCCSLLRSPDVDRAEYEDDAAHLLAAYPERHRVRLDVRTGVCVFTEALGGEISGRGHDLRIEAVDEPMADALFVEPRRPLFGRRGRRPGPPRPGLA